MNYKLEMVDVREEFRTQYIKGRAEGREEERRQTIKKMLARNMSKEEIASILDLNNCNV